MTAPKKILVIRPEKLGDLVVATPVFRALKASFPSSHLTVVTDELYGDILQDDPHVDHILRVQWKWRWRGKHEPIISLARKVRNAGRFDLALILYPNWAGWNAVCALAGVRRVVQLGGTWAAPLLGHRVVRRHAYERLLHYRDYYLETAGAAGVRLPQGDKGDPRVWIQPVAVRDFLAKWPRTPDRTRVIVHPFGHGSSPNYSLEAYRGLAARIATEWGSEVFVTGGAGDLKHWDVAESPDGVSTAWMGKLTLRELMAACASSDAVVCGSTGVIHLAAALGVPTVGVFCPHPGSHPRSWGPLGGLTANLVVPESLCRRVTPAASSTCTGTMECDLRCGISPDQVFNALRRVLEK